MEIKEEKYFLSFFRDHPISILVLTLLICTSIGYWGEYSLLKHFGLNIVVFAQMNDFLLAGLKNPSIFLISFIIVIFGTAFVVYRLNILEQNQKFMLPDQLELNAKLKQAKAKGRLGDIEDFKRQVQEQKILLKQRRTSEKRQVCMMISGIIISSLLIMLLILHFDLRDRIAKITVNPEQKTVVQLLTGKTLPANSKGTENNENPMVLITATENYMFFYQKNNEKAPSVFTVPVSSISTVTHSKIKK